MSAIVLRELSEEEREKDPLYKYGVEEKKAEPKSVGDDETQIKVHAVALNHREIWLLRGAYFTFEAGGVLCSDGVGIVEESNSTKGEPFQKGDRVLPNPGKGWIHDAAGPEGDFYIIGLPPCEGTMSSTYTVDTEDFALCPDHLSDAEAAALPLAGLTAYRALFTKCNVTKGKNVLITGIGGGVALFALQFAVSVGANVYVTSSCEEKIDKAIKLGAKGGVNYKKDTAEILEDFNAMLGKQSSRPLPRDALFDAIVDGAGGPLFAYYHTFMKPGSIFANYGQTAEMALPFCMNYTLNNIDLRGSTMGSRREFHEMVKFVKEHKIKPIVSAEFNGFTADAMSQALNVMKEGKQFGKIVIHNKEE